MKTHIQLKINDQQLQIERGISVAAAIAIAASTMNEYSGVTRVSVTGQLRGVFCGMGVCQECRVTINGQKHQLACQTLCADDMQIFTGTLA
jgi:D-hydroxyproline dehydrogenase subunit gamma